MVWMRPLRGRAIRRPPQALLAPVTTVPAYASRPLRAPILWTNAAARGVRMEA